MSKRKADDQDADEHGHNKKKHKPEEKEEKEGKEEKEREVKEPQSDFREANFIQAVKQHWGGAPHPDAMARFRQSKDQYDEDMEQEAIKKGGGASVQRELKGHFEPPRNPVTYERIVPGPDVPRFGPIAKGMLLEQSNPATTPSRHREIRILEKAMEKGVYLEPGEVETRYTTNEVSVPIPFKLDPEFEDALFEDARGRREDQRRDARWNNRTQRWEHRHAGTAEAETEGDATIDMILGAEIAEEEGGPFEIRSTYNSQRRRAVDFQHGGAKGVPTRDMQWPGGAMWSGGNSLAAAGIEDPELLVDPKGIRGPGRPPPIQGSQAVYWDEAKQDYVQGGRVRGAGSDTAGDWTQVGANTHTFVRGGGLLGRLGKSNPSKMKWSWDDQYFPDPEDPDAGGPEVYSSYPKTWSGTKQHTKTINKSDIRDPTGQSFDWETEELIDREMNEYKKFIEKHPKQSQIIQKGLTEGATLLRESNLSDTPYHRRVIEYYREIHFGKAYSDANPILWPPPPEDEDPVDSDDGGDSQDDIDE